MEPRTWSDPIRSAILSFRLTHTYSPSCRRPHSFSLPGRQPVPWRGPRGRRRFRVTPRRRFLTKCERTDINQGAKKGVSTMRRHIFVGVAGVSLILAAAPLRAHHAFSAEFDADKPLKLEGTLVKTEWINPHAWLHIEVKKPD